MSLAPVFLWAASTQAAPRSVYFWNSAAGTEGARIGMGLANVGVWGNGEFSDARNVKYEGANTLKITTRNFREGVRFDLKAPLDIAEYREAGYIRLRLRFREAVLEEGVPGEPGAFGEPGTFGGAQMGALPPLGSMGGLPPGLGDGGMPIPSGPTPQETPITQLLCTLVLDNGIMEGTIDIPKSWENSRRIDFDKVRPDSNGWLLLALKMKDMRSTPGAGGLVRNMILSADKQDSFHLTQAALVVETGAMTAAIREVRAAPGTQVAEITTRPGSITLVADVEAGAADPSIEWNFDADNVGNLPRVNLDGMPPGTPGGFPGEENPDRPRPPMMDGAPGGEGVEGEEIQLGPRIDAKGLIARFTYPNEEQNYRVEVTVRDRSGKKAPVKTSVIIKVRG